jgi:hypothetical protein
LYLNVFAPSSVKASSKKAVMVFFPGGGFVSGGSALPTYDGTCLASQDVIVVTANYRLGIFGGFASSELMANGSSSGAYGFLDQQMVLKWVHENIELFGGLVAFVFLLFLSFLFVRRLKQGDDFRAICWRIFRLHAQCGFSEPSWSVVSARRLGKRTLHVADTAHQPAASDHRDGSSRLCFAALQNGDAKPQLHRCRLHEKSVRRCSLGGCLNPWSELELCSR